MNYKLIYTVKTSIIKELRHAFEEDPSFYNDGTGVSRSNVPKILDGWGFEAREFPLIIVTGSTGANRREGIADVVDTVNYVVLQVAATDPNTATARTFVVNNSLLVGVDVTVKNKNTTPTLFTAKVQAGTGGDSGKMIIQLTGTTIGPDVTYPMKRFLATADQMTGDRYGGWYNLSLDITCAARSTIERERLSDKILSFIWFANKKRLREKYNLHVMDVRAAGEASEKYGADMIYFSKMNITLNTEWEEIQWYDKTIETIGITESLITV